MRNEISNRIKTIRDNRKLSQSEFAEKLGMKFRTYVDLEMGITKPSGPVLLAIEYVFGVDKKWILTGRENLIKLRRKDDLITDKRYFIASDILKEIFTEKDQGVIDAIYSNLLQFKRIPIAPKTVRETPKKKSTPGK